MSTRPKVFNVSSTAAVIVSGLRTSITIGKHRLPVAHTNINYFSKKLHK